MSGGTGGSFQQSQIGDQDVPDTSGSRNHLLCFICNELYENPCLLTCFHTFCARCLRGRFVDGKMTCPICGKQTSLKEGNSLPPSDPLMRFLVEGCTEEQPPCANCDKRDKAAMYFCNTCGQALCGFCREDTHKAKMFSTHDVIHMSKRTKEARQRCSRHGEEFVMFSTAQKAMLCINCFREMALDARLHCVDIDTAYSRSCKKLDRAMVSAHEIQRSVRDGVILFKALLEELRRNMEIEKNAVNALCRSIQEAVAKTHANLLTEVQNQFEAKDRVFRSQLTSLATLLPTIQVHLIMCATFTNAANKFEFLQLAQSLVERLAGLTHMCHPPRPTQSTQVKTSYRSEFSRAVEPWVIKMPREGGPAAPGDGGYDVPPHPPAPAAQPHPTTRRQQNALRAKALEDEGPFANHCRSFDTQLKELMQRLDQLKEQVTELHRDVSIRHCLAPQIRVDRIVRDCADLEEQLEHQQSELDRLKTVFDAIWEEQLCRIQVEQEIFQSQVCGMCPTTTCLLSLISLLLACSDVVNLGHMFFFWTKQCVPSPLNTIQISFLS